MPIVFNVREGREGWKIVSQGKLFFEKIILCGECYCINILVLGIKSFKIISEEENVNSTPKERHQGQLGFLFFVDKYRFVNG